MLEVQPTKLTLYGWSLRKDEGVIEVDQQSFQVGVDKGIVVLKIKNVGSSL